MVHVSMVPLDSRGFGTVPRIFGHVLPHISRLIFAALGSRVNVLLDNVGELFVGGFFFI
jgi:hypothetical protein